MLRFHREAGAAPITHAFLPAQGAVEEVTGVELQSRMLARVHRTIRWELGPTRVGVLLRACPTGTTQSIADLQRQRITNVRNGIEAILEVKDL